LLDGRVLVKILSINRATNSVILRRYDDFHNEAVEYDTAPGRLTPMFKIGDVAKMLSRSPETIRKYEREGLIIPATQFPLTREKTAMVRLYTEKDIYDLMEFFAERSSRRGKKFSAVNQKDLLAYIRSRYRELRRG